MKINHINLSNKFYEAFMKVLNLFKVEDIRQSLNLKPRDIILDCGAGSGYYARNLQKYVTKVYALDASHDFEDKVEGNDKITVIRKECPPIPFEDGFFDKIYITDVLHHIESDKQGALLKEFYRILKPKGILGILDFDTKNSFFGKIIYSFEKIAGFPCTFMQPDKIKRLLSGIGFDADITRINKHTYIAKGVKPVSSDD
jgi:ubiquinone/menaquinone biosynthesis C-methylase UbiE